jgi:AcrR family transcriptional regulator
MAFEPLTPERRRAMTRRHLLDAAAIVFGRSGFHGATLDDVATTAGFTKGAVYSNFKSKDDLFLALLDDRIDRQFQMVGESLDAGASDSDDQLPRIREMLHNEFFWDEGFSALWLEFVLYARRNPEARAKLVASAERSRIRVQQLIEHEYAAAGIRPKYPPRELTLISLALFEGLAMTRLMDPETMSDQILDTTLAFLSDAMDMPREATSTKRT